MTARAAVASALCPECRTRPPVRGRKGLCLACYFRPGVKERYKSASRYNPGTEPTADEVERLVAEQMASLPPWWHAETLAERGQVAPPDPPGVPDPEPAALARAATRTGYDLHPSTEPAVIRAAQAADVVAYLRARPGASDDEVSGAVTLPLWNVRRCREELGRAA